MFLMNNFVGHGKKAFEFTAGQRAQENAVLHMLAMVFEQLEEFGPSLVVRDVVSAEVNPAVVGYRTTGRGKWRISPRSRRTSRRA